MDRDEFNLQEAFELSRVTMQTLLAINGGGAVAILAFYGQALTAGGGLNEAARQGFAGSLTWFGAGVALATFTLFAAYWVQLLWGLSKPSGQEEHYHRRAERLHFSVFLLALASMAAFTGGCWSARGAIMASLDRGEVAPLRAAATPIPGALDMKHAPAAAGTKQ